VKLHRIMGVLIAVASLVAAIAIRSPLIAYVDVISVMLAWLMPVLLLVVTYGRRSGALARAIGSWLKGRDGEPGEGESHRSLAAMARDYGQYAVLNGCICAVIGHVMMLTNMSDPSAIGPALAVSLFTILYGFLIQLLIAVPVRHHHLALAGADPAEFAHQGLHLRALGLIGFSSGISFLLMLVAMSSWV